MDKWTEGELTPKPGNGFSTKHAFLIGLAIVVSLVVFYLYTCTCVFGESICYKNGKTIDERTPQTMELEFSFLNSPGTVVYPWASIKLKEEGSVGILLKIDKEGVITSSDLTSTSGHPYLDKAALDAVSTFSVNKEKINNETGEEKTVRITFELSE